MENYQKIKHQLLRLLATESPLAHQIIFNLTHHVLNNKTYAQIFLNDSIAIDILMWASKIGNVNIVELIYQKIGEYKAIKNLEDAVQKESVGVDEGSYLHYFSGIAKVFYNLFSGIQPTTINTSIHLKDKDGNTAMHWATYYGHIDVLKCIVANIPDGSDVSEYNPKNNRRYSPLHNAAAKGQLTSVDVILDAIPLTAKEDDILFKNDKKCTPLNYAASRHHTHIIATVLRRLDRINNKGTTPLHWAAQKGCFNIVEDMLCGLSTQEIADLINCKDAAGMTPLYLAAQEQYFTIARYLLNQEGVNVNQVGPNSLYDYFTDGTDSEEIITKILRFKGCIESLSMQASQIVSAFDGMSILDQSSDIELLSSVQFVKGDLIDRCDTPPSLYLRIREKLLDLILIVSRQTLPIINELIKRMDDNSPSFSSGVESKWNTTLSEDLLRSYFKSGIGLEHSNAIGQWLGMLKFYLKSEEFKIIGGLLPGEEATGAFILLEVALANCPQGFLREALHLSQSQYYLAWLKQKPTTQKMKDLAKICRTLYCDEWLYIQRAVHCELGDLTLLSEPLQIAKINEIKESSWYLSIIRKCRSPNMVHSIDRMFGLVLVSTNLIGGELPLVLHCALAHGLRRKSSNISIPSVNLDESLSSDTRLHKRKKPL